MRVRYKPWAKDYLQTLAFHRFIDEFDFNTILSGNFKTIAVEIGVGKGDFLLLMAQKFPDIFFVGVELNVSVCAVAAQKLATSNLPNVLLVNGDALLLMPKIPPVAIDYVILNHSDPWPKKRHEKRRLTYPPFVDEYVRILKSGGQLIFKSDNDEFSDYSFEVLTNYTFNSLNFNRDYDGSASFDAMTEYERKFREKNVKIKRITAEK